MSTPDAQRLADWLEGLGLAGQLEAAGLPTYVRDEAGRARWTDPGTGEPLTRRQLGELDGLLREDGTEPEHAVPVALVQLARQARVRAALLASAWHTYETLAEVRGTTVASTRFAVHKAAGTHRLLVVPVEERSVVPAFQLDAAGEVRRELVPVLEPLLTAVTDPWQVWSWLTQPAALLGGLVPEQAAADPAEAATVLHAAVRLAERLAR